MIHVFRYAMVVLYTILWGIPASILGVLGAGQAVEWIARHWIGWIMWTCRIRIEATGLGNLPEEPFIVMSNHQSVVDIAAIVMTIPVSWRFVAKRELTWIPLFGWALATGGHIIVDRKDREKAIHSLERGAERIRRGTNVIIFPEGTRSTTGTLGPFKSGGFHLAIAAQVPIVPASVSGTGRITPKGSLNIESGRVRIHYGRPIPTEKLTLDDRNQLKESVREGILPGYDPDLQDPPPA